MVMQDLFLIATDSQVIPEDREHIGTCIVIVMIANITFAVGIMMNQSIRETIRQCKMKKKRNLAVKMAKEKRAAPLTSITAKIAVPARPLSPIQEEPIVAVKNKFKKKRKSKSKATKLHPQTDRL